MRRHNRLEIRIARLLDVVIQPMSAADIWRIVGGSSGRVHVVLALMEKHGAVISRKHADGRWKYEAQPWPGTIGSPGGERSR